MYANLETLLSLGQMNAPQATLIAAGAGAMKCRATSGWEIFANT